MGPEMTENVKTADSLKADHFRFEYRQKTHPSDSNLDLLSYGTYRLPDGGASDELYHHRHEAMLFCLQGEVSVRLDQRAYRMAHYDTLYLPMATAYSVANDSPEEALLAVFRAPAEKKHAPFFARWEEFSRNESRIRHLQGKEVYLMLDVSEPADKLIAGYTIYEPQTRAWPAHNHTDQEEIYLFTKGTGAMEVYADEERKSFVTSVGPMDAVSIPVLNYHPVFSQEQELHFIWCISGERYWVGDKNQDFMKGDTDKLTT